jgi:hypothetical protein
MQGDSPVFKGAFQISDPGYYERQQLGIRPVVFDILAPDLSTSILPADLRLVLHTNPRTMSIEYSKLIERIQTNGGYVEQHWGSNITNISFEAATGGFMRLFSGLSNVTGGPGSISTEGSRRETLAYDKYLDLLALFHNNGSIYDRDGRIIFQGAIQITFDEGIYIGWFSNFKKDEVAEKPYMFELSASFVVDREIIRFRSDPYYYNSDEPLELRSDAGEQFNE